MSAYIGPYAQELETAIEAARAASGEVLRFYNDQSAETYVKGDGSPVTDADLAADTRIRSMMQSAFPQDALLTEETPDTATRRSNPRCWIVDPIDGTAEYVERTGQFDVLIALAVGGRPVVGVASQPVTGVILAAVAGQGAWEVTPEGNVPLRFAQAATPPRLATSKWYGAQDPVRVAAMIRIAAEMDTNPPVSLNVGFQARLLMDRNRTWDAYVGLPQLDQGSAANEWDFAAVDVITHEAGGRFTDAWGRLHRYNKISPRTSGGILVSSDSGLHDRLLEVIAPELPVIPPADPGNPQEPEATSD